ncbi:MAG: DMT family transporter [Agathobacter sp.]|nr:DMT family transporter [Agathobacter sp.]
MDKQLKHTLLLFLAAGIWGFAFVAQSVGMDYVGSFTFTALRNFIGALVLAPVILVLDKRKSKEVRIREKKEQKTLIRGGILCGFFLCIATNLQQFGIPYTTIGKAGFLTAMYIILVPVLGIFCNRRAGRRVWISVALAVWGLYLLCMAGGSLVLQVGDLFELGCALAFAVQILTIDHFAPKVDCVKLSCIEFVSCGILSAIGMVLFESPTIEAVQAAWIPILYAGALSTGVAYTLQIVGQKGLNPTLASLIMSLESVISLIAGWVLLNQKLSKRELVGCAIMFAAIILVQLPEKKKCEIITSEE